MSFAKVVRAVAARTSALGNRGNDCYRLRAFRPHNSYNTQHGKCGREMLKTSIGCALALDKKYIATDVAYTRFYHAVEPAMSKDNLKNARSVHAILTYRVRIDTHRSTTTARLQVQ